MANWYDDEKKKQGNIGAMAGVQQAVNSAAAGAVQGVANQTSYQSMLYQPTKQQTWYKGSQPTTGEIVNRIHTIWQTNPAKAKTLYDQFSLLQQDKSSPYYSPYQRPTNQAAQELANLGFNTADGITQEWLDANKGLMNYYRTGVDGSPLAPTKKSSVAENAAYWYYKAAKAEEETEKAENEQNALREEITYWANRTDLNLSDDEILQKINWSKYKTLSALDDGKSIGVPVSLNRKIDYSRDNLRGMIWAARNNGGSGNAMIDAARAASGVGNQYAANPDKIAKRDMTSDRYNPYAVSSTVDDAALYFGVPSFDKDWCERNKDILNGTDKTAIEQYKTVYSAEETTQNAESEAEAFLSAVDTYLESCYDADRVLTMVDYWIDDKETYPTLNKMVNSLRPDKDLLKMTRPINFDLYDLKDKIVKSCEEKKNAVEDDTHFSQTVDTVSGGGGYKPTQGEAALSKAKNASLQTVAPAIVESGTDAERAVMNAGYSAGYNEQVTAATEALLGGAMDPTKVVNITAKNLEQNIVDNYYSVYMGKGNYNQAIKARDTVAKAYDDEIEKRIKARDEWKASLEKDIEEHPEWFERTVTEDDARHNNDLLQTMDRISQGLDVPKALADEVRGKVFLYGGGVEGERKAREEFQNNSSFFDPEEAKRSYVFNNERYRELDNAIREAESEKKEKVAEYNRKVDSLKPAYDKAIKDENSLNRSMKVAITAMTLAGTSQEEMSNLLLRVSDAMFRSYDENSHDTLKGAQKWVENAKDDDEKNIARTNLWFVEHKYKYDQIKDSEEYKKANEGTWESSGGYGSTSAIGLHYRPVHTEQSYKETKQWLLQQFSSVGQSPYHDNTASGRFNILGVAGLDQVPIEELENLGLLFATSPAVFMDSISNDDLDMIMYLRERGGDEEAADYIEYMAYEWNKKTMEELTKRAQEKAGDSPVLASVFSVLDSLGSGAGYLDAKLQDFNNWIADTAPLNINAEWRPVDYNSAAMTMSRMSSATRQKVQELVDWQVNVFGKDADLFDFFYGATMSGIDSISTLSIYGPVGVALLLGGSAATSMMENLRNLGGSDRQILLGGFLAGTFEALFEYISLDKIFNSKELLAEGGVKNLVKNIFLSAGIEGSEEFNTGIADMIGMMLVMGDKDEYISKYNEYKAKYGEAEAIKRIALEATDNILQEGVAGAFMGMFFGGGKGISQYGRANAAQYQSNYERETSNYSAYSGGRYSNLTQDQITQEYLQAQAEVNGEFGENNIADGEQRLQELEAAREASIAATRNAVSPLGDVAYEGDDSTANVAKRLYALQEAQQEQDVGKKNAVMAASLRAGSIDVNTAKAATNALINEYGADEALNLMIDLMTQGVSQGVSQDAVRKMICQAALTNGTSKAALFTVAQQGVTAETFGWLQSAYEVDSANQATQEEVETATKENRVAEKTNEILAGEESSAKIADANTAVQDAKAALDRAREHYRSKEQELLAARQEHAQSLRTLAESGHTSEENHNNMAAAAIAAQEAVERAQTDLDNTSTNVVAPAEQALEKAQENYDNVVSEEQAKAREQAIAEVEAEEQQAAEQKAQQAYDDAVALLPPTTPFGKVVTVTLTNGESVGITGVAYTTEDGTRYFTTANGGVVSENALDDASSLYEQTDYDNDFDEENVQKQMSAAHPDVSFPISYQVMNKNTGEMVHAIGYAKNTESLEANVMLADGTVVPMHELDFSGLSLDEKADLVDVYANNTDVLTKKENSTDDLWIEDIDDTQEGIQENAEETAETEGTVKAEDETAAEGEETTEETEETGETEEASQEEVDPNESEETTEGTDETVAADAQPTNNADKTGPAAKSNEKLTKAQKENVKASESMQLESWQDPKNHGKVKKPRKAKTGTKAFAKWFSDPTGDLSNPDGTPKIFYRGFGNFGSHMYIKHQSKGDSAGNYYNFYMDKISTAKSYAGSGSKVLSLYDMVNWETAQAAMADIGYSLKQSPNPANPSEMGYMLYNQYGNQVEWYGENDLAKFNDSYGGTPETKGIFAGYITAKNPLVIDAKNHSYGDVKATVVDAKGNPYSGSMKTRKWAQWAFQNGYDALIVKNVSDNVNGAGEYGLEVVTRSSQQYKSIYNNGKWSNKADIRYYKAGTFALTGKPLSQEFLNAQHRLLNGEHLTNEELMAIPELQWSDAHERKGSSMEDMIKNGQADQFKSRVQEWAENLIGLGSYSGYTVSLDGKKVSQYNGEVKQDKRLDIVIGPPSAGKSTVAVDPISRENGSRVLDSDTVKQMIPEYEDGLNSGYVHMESREAMKKARILSIQSGDNVVLPVVGWDAESVRRDAQPFIDAGYTVYLHHVDLDYSKAMGRMLGRMAEDGRNLGVTYLNDTVQNKPRAVYQSLKGANWIAGYEQISNDVPKGSKPILIESQGLGRSDGRNSQQSVREAGTAGPAGLGTSDGPAGGLRYLRGKAGPLQQSAQSESGEQSGTGSGSQVNISTMQNGTQAQSQGASSMDVQSGQQIMENLAEKLGMVYETRSKKYLRRLKRGTAGYTMENGVVHVQNAQSVYAGSHEIGHNLNKALHMESMVADMDALRASYDSKYGSAFLSQYEDAQVPGELMAEFTRIWLGDRAQAVAFAGQDFVNQFETALNKKGWLKPMKEAAQRIHDLATADAISRARAMIDLDIKQDKGDKSVRGLRGIGAKYFDRTLPFNQVTQILHDTQGAAFDWSRDTRTLALAQNNVAYNMANQSIEEGLVDSRGDRVLDENGKEMPGLQDITKRVKAKDEKDFNVYLMAFRSLDSEAAGKATYDFSGDPQAVISEMERLHPEFKQIKTDLINWYNTMMQTWVVDTGLKSQAEFDAMRAVYPNYVPAIPSSAKAQSGKSQPGKAPGNVVRRATGNNSNTSIYNPVAAMVEDVYRYFAIAKQVETLRAFSDQMDEMMANGEDISAFAEPAQKDIVRVSNRQANQDASRVVHDKVADLVNQGKITADVANELVAEMANLQDEGYQVRNYSSDGDVINIPMADGTVKSWTVYNKAMLSALTAMPSAQRSRAYRALSRMTRFLCSMATSRNIAFAAQNFFSDTETAANTGRGSFVNGLLPVYAARQVYSAASLLKNIIAGTKAGQRVGLSQSETYRLFQLFGQMGSRYSSRDIATQRATRKSLYSNSTTVGDVVTSILRSPVIAIESVADFLEDTTRYTAFRTSGDSISTYEGRLRAGQNAREASVDFSKSGYADLGWVKAIKPFLGAQLQGLYKTARLFSSENAGNRVKTAGRILINGILLNLGLAAIRGMFWDDKDKDAYDQLTAYEKSKYYHIKNPDGTFTRVKRSQDAIIQVSDAIGEFLGNILTGHEGDDWGELMNVGIAIAQNATINADSTLDPFLDALNNKTWYGGAIDDYNDLQQSTTARYDPNTPKIFRAISNLANGMGIQYSPKQIEYIASQYLGSFGTIGSGIFDLSAQGNLNAENVKDVVVDYLAGKFVVDPVYLNGLSTSFYASKTNLSEMIKEADRGKSPELLRYDLTDEERGKAYAEAKRLTSKGGEIYNLSQEISDLWKQHDEIQSNENLTREEKKEQARAVREQINAAYLAGNTIMGDFWAKYGYNNALEQNAMNTINLYTEHKDTIDTDQATADILYMSVPQTFRDDEGKDYMKMTMDVFNVTGKATNLPAPNHEPEYLGVKYLVSDEDAAEYDKVYKEKYEAAILGYLAKWSSMSMEEKENAVKSARTKANDAARKWYAMLYNIQTKK